VAVTYTVAIRRDEDGNYCVSVPAIRGCFTYGATWEEALENAEEAVLCCLDAMAKDGEPPPPNVDPVAVSMEESDQVVLHRLTVREAVLNV
jgi:antitoxin HicB